MKHIVALLVKSLMVGAIVYLILPRFGVTAPSQIWTTIATVVISAYIIGDLLILPSTNNIIATIADGGWAAAVIWFVNNGGGMMTLSTSGVLIAAAAIAIGEYFLHMYLIRTETVRMRLRTEPDGGPGRPD